MLNNKMAIQGNAFYSLNKDSVKYVEQGVFCVDADGYIEAVYKENDENYESVRQTYLENGKLRILSESEVMLPGFIDLHIHAPQFPQAGTALDRPLEVWLQEYTFPLEAKYSDLDFANEVYQEVVHTTLRHGTTTALYFATVHRESSTLLARLCGEMGQRGLVGKVVMDDPEGNPEYIRDASPEEAINETEKFIKEVLEFQNFYKQKVYPVVTPRFIPSCTSEALEGLAKLAKKYDVHIQTHCSESDWAHQFVKDKYEVNDAQALDNFGLITDKTVLAHAPFLDQDDQNLVAEKETSIAHCPLSNAYFANSVMPFKEFTENGVNVGLGSDISGGYAPSMYQSIRQAVVSSRMLQDGVNPSLPTEERGKSNAQITLNNALYAATVAGGEALNLPIGKLEKGYAFDVQILNIEKNIPHFYKEQKIEDLLHKVLLLTESSNIEEVWVQGDRVI